MIFDNTDMSTESLYQKYMAFNKVMMEEHSPIEIASIMVIQGLSFYRTVMSEEDYQKIVKNIYDRRDQKTLKNFPLRK